MTVCETLNRIFADMPRDHLVRRRSGLRLVAQTTAAEETSSSSNSSKRTKREPSEHLFRPEVIRLVSEFLNPIDLQTWSCVCKTIREVCNLVVKLDGMFSYFRILKRPADKLHGTSCDWKIVYKLLYQGVKELRRVYGPYQVHPLHAAIAGEFILWAISRRGELPMELSATTTLEDLELYSSFFVVGKYGDYFSDDEGLEYCYEEHVKTRNAAKLFPPGPAKTLIEEGCMPLIHLFTSEAESHTDQMGIFFPITSDDDSNNNDNDDDGDDGDDDDRASNTGGKEENDDIPIDIFCLNYQELPSDYTGDEFLNWYKDELAIYDRDCKSIAQAFCQLVPLCQEEWDDWTQLLRAAWLKSHGMTPFDDETDGCTERWESLLESLSLEDRALLKEPLSADQEAPEVLKFCQNKNQETLEYAKEKAMIYLRLKHEYARASNYV